MRMSDSWNLVVYRAWAPVYDATVERLFAAGRRRSLELLNLQPGERVLLVGVGTGADLPLLPAGVTATGVDLSEPMLDRARRKLPHCRASVTLVQGDAQSLAVAPGSFDAAILHLILSVVPNGNACLRSAVAALAPGGRAVVFDKFAPETPAGPSVARRGVNAVSTVLGTDVTRRLTDVLAGCGVRVVRDEPSVGRGTYRVIVLEKEPVSA